MKFGCISTEVKKRQTLFFLFFCKHNRIWVSAHGLSHVWLFCFFCSKISSNVLLNAFTLENFVVLTKNSKRQLIFCYKNKYINRLHTFTIKIDIRNISESREFKWEKWFKIGSKRVLLLLLLLLLLWFFFHGKTLSLKKNEKRHSVFYNKNTNNLQFHVFAIKNDFRNVSESIKLRIENSLKLIYKN